MEIFKRPADSNKDHYEAVGQALSRRRVIRLRGPITPIPYRVDVYGPSTVEDMIMEFQAEDDTKPIWLIIDSPGGDVETGFALYDTMKLATAPIYTVGQSCASMAATILAAGNKGRRYVMQNCRTMIQPPSGQVSGTTNEVRNAVEQMEQMRDRIIQAYIDCGVTKSKKQIQNDWVLDYWLDAHAVIKYGLADRIMDTEDFREMLNPSNG